MAKIDKQEFELKITQVDMHQIITQAVENARLKVQQRSGTIESKLEASNSIIPGDKTHLSNIIHNLFDNAEKYSAEKPTIHIQTKDVVGGIEVKIRDQGIGMTKESLKHIFNKFFRVHTGNRHDVKGFGLGLSYVKALIDAHHGTVHVTSELGKGSTFTLFFPNSSRK